MTNLTEQWKKGELPDGHYYVKDGENIIAELLDGYFYNDGQPMTSFSGGVDEVLAEVPTFEEWQASENYIDYLKQCISVYESKDKQATETSIAYNELLEENDKLKELLKDCREILDYAKDFAYHDPCCKCIAKINQVLGEE